MRPAKRPSWAPFCIAVTEAGVLLFFRMPATFHPWRAVVRAMAAAAKSEGAPNLGAWHILGGEDDSNGKLAARFEAEGWQSLVRYQWAEDSKTFIKRT